MKEKVYKILKELNIKYNEINHPALFTEGDEEKYGLEFSGVEYKNLFLRNKNKSKFYLYSLPLKQRADLKELAIKLNEKKLCFANDTELLEKLGIKSGSVSVLNIIEVEETDCIFVLDEDFKEKELVDFHPNDNTATVELMPKDIIRVLNKYNAEIMYV
ncbi:MAG: YbaK/EbsC family protein [Clostridia bacterium]